MPDFNNDPLEPWFYEWDNGPKTWQGASHYRFPVNYLSLSLIDDKEQPLKGLAGGSFEAYLNAIPRLIYDLSLSSYSDISVMLPDTNDLGVWLPSFDLYDINDKNKDFEEVLYSPSTSSSTQASKTTSLQTGLATNTPKFEAVIFS